MTVAPAKRRTRGPDKKPRTPRPATPTSAAPPTTLPPFSTTPLATPPTGIRVILTRRGGFGSVADDHEVMWPPGWRLPAAGESVHLSAEFGGFVEYVDWDIAARAVRVFLR